MQFPTDLSDRYYMSLTFYKYQRPNPFSLSTRLIPISISEGGAIRLPLPGNLTDALSLRWEQSEVNNPIIQGIDLGREVYNQAGGGTTGAAAGVAAGGAAAIAKNYLNSNPLGQKLQESGAIDQSLQFFGLAQNPALTMLFRHPEFKQHSFSWKFSPNKRKESDILNKIIKTITRASLPSTTAGGALFTYPDICQINISNNQYMYSFQPAVITNISTNYTPTNVPSFYAGTFAPSTVVMSLSFKEIILNTRDNFDGTTSSATPYSGIPQSLIGLGENLLGQFNSGR